MTDREKPPRGLSSSAWPVLALALILLVLLRACAPSPPVTPATNQGLLLEVPGPLDEGVVGRRPEAFG